MMGFKEAPPPIDTSKLEVIAKATSYGIDNQIRWTELELYYRPGERRPFVSVSIAKTKVRGEDEWTRQRVAKTIEEACRLFDNSRLHDAIVEQAQRWLDAHPEAETPAKAAKVAGFSGDSLHDALLWLYPDAPADASDNHLAKLFAGDFEIPERSVRHTLAAERRGKDQPDGARPAWCIVFLAALKHFDRKAFAATR